MTDVALAGPSLRKFRSASTEAPAACAPLIAVAVAFLFFFLLLPLAIVFFEAFRRDCPPSSRASPRRTRSPRSSLP